LVDQSSKLVLGELKEHKLVSTAAVTVAHLDKKAAVENFLFRTFDVQE
jgi:hypothetical protein